MNVLPDLIVTNAAVYTGDSATPRAEAIAVSGGVITAVGTADEVGDLAVAGTELVNADGRMLMPGLTDVHAHLMFGGTSIAWELTLQPDDGLEVILSKVKAHVQSLDADEWVIGGKVGSPVMDQLASGRYLPALDTAAGGRPVLLRDDSYHNRWVSSRALEIMGVDKTTSDPRDGAIVRDLGGELTGVLYESACTLVERAAATSIQNPTARNRVSIHAALQLMNSFGITAIQDAATLEPSLRALSDLSDTGELSAWVVASLPARPYMSDDIVGDELYAAAPVHRRDQVRPDFAKFFLDGVPVTRSSALLAPYLCHGPHEDPTDRGALLWTDVDLIAGLERCHEAGLGAKLHATGDRAVRQALDAIQVVRERHGAGPLFHIAHVEYIAVEDIPRFTALGVVADASPYIWFPTQFEASINNQVPPAIVERSWPLRELVDNGALLAAGSDWPIVPTPNPWIAMEGLITRANPDPGISGQLNPSAAITLTEAVSAFTSSGAKAMGMADTIGTIATGRSADFVLLDHDLFDIDTTAIHRTQVRQTYFRGRRVFGDDL